MAHLIIKSCSVIWIQIKAENHFLSTAEHIIWKKMAFIQIWSQYNTNMNSGSGDKKEVSTEQSQWRSKCGDVTSAINIFKKKRKRRTRSTPTPRDERASKSHASRNFG